MQLIRELAQQIRRRWKSQQHDQAKFSDIAVELLAEVCPSRHLTPREILSWLSTVDELPPQPNIAVNFGEPGIQLYNGDGFFIEALFWVDGTTSIHQHSFSGAFHVLAGSSLHTTYAFEEQRRINDYLLSGELAWRQSELLATGATRRIVAGRSMIHSLFHLDRPSVTLVVRTHHEPAGGLQYAYLRPGFAHYDKARNARTTRCSQALRMLLQTDQAEFRRMAKQLLASSDYFICHTLLTDFALIGDDELLPLVAVLRERDPLFADRCEAMLYELQREHDIIQSRAQVRDAEHRFFLALLLNVPNRKTILEMVRHRFEEDRPHERVGRWLVELTDPSAGAPQLAIEMTPQRRRALEKYLASGGQQSHDESIKYLQEFSALDPLFE